MSQIIRKFIEDNAINGAKRRLDNNEVERARNAAGNADISLFKLDAADEFKILTQPKADDALPLPADAKDYITVEWAQNFLSGQKDPKDAVAALADANVALTGATPLVIDGVTLTDGKNVGLIEQTDASENGSYVVTITGPNYTLTRSSGFDQSEQVTKGAYFPVSGGTNYAGYTVILVTDDPIVLDTTDLEFIAYPSAISIIAGDMIAKTGNTLSLDIASLGGLESTNPGNVSGQVRVKVDTAVTEKDQTTRRDSVTGAVVAKRDKKKPVTLSPTNITNQYIDLDDVAEQDSVDLRVSGAGEQSETDDFTVNYTGGASSKTRVTFAGGLATGGVSALVSGEKIVIHYRAF